MWVRIFRFGGDYGSMNLPKDPLDDLLKVRLFLAGASRHNDRRGSGGQDTHTNKHS